MADKSEKPGFDAGRQQLGVTYARALLAAARNAGQLDTVLEEIDSLIDDVFARLPDLENALCTPRVAHEDKEQLLDKAFQGKMTPVLLTFLKVVSRHGRTDCLRDMRRAARRIYNEEHGRVEVSVRTASEVDDELAQALAERLSAALGRQVEMQRDVQPDLIGGMVVRVGDTVYDASVANRLRRMREDTIQKTTQTIRDVLERFTDE